MSRNRLPELARIAAARREAALAALSRATTDRDAVVADIAALRKRVAEAREQAAASLSAADAVTAEQFAALAETRQATLNLALARLSVAANERRAEAALAHGQSNVLDRLASRDLAKRQVAYRKRLSDKTPESGF